MGRRRVRREPDGDKGDTLVNAFRFMADAYGQLRGYGRWTIRRAVERNARRDASALAAEAQALFDRRVRDAMARFPAYAEKVRRHLGQMPDDGRRIVPEELPIWRRADQRELFAALTAPPVPGSFAHSTGGSTGVPLRFYVTRESFEWWSAVSDRGYSWAGAEEGRRSFYVWGTPIKAPGAEARAKQGLHHALQRRTYFDSFQFGDTEKRRCCEILDRVKPPAVVGYAGNLVELARFVRDNPGALAWRAASLVTAAEGLAPGARELIEAHLGGRVFVSYGSREFMLIGMECREHRGYHIASDNLFVEVVNAAGAPAAPGETGRILVTDLHNDANPFVRYEIGDLGTLFEPGCRCPCGLPFPRLAAVEGRDQEVIVTASGERLTALFIPHLMKEFPWVEGYQIAQGEKGAFTVKLISRDELTPARLAPIEQALRRKVGEDTRIRFEKVAMLDKNPSGKTPIVLCG